MQSGLIVAVLLAISTILAAEPEPEFNSVMMQNTFEIKGPDDRPLGSGFLITKPLNSSGARLKVLVTADHVFSSNTLDTVVVNARRQTEGQDWTIIKIPLKIRDGDKRLWQKSPDADVAAIYCSVPDPPVSVGAELLADDSFLTREEIHPGDSVFVLGYPLGISGRHGFPVLRPGVISSYPLTPTSKYPLFEIALTAFPGNSGGPVYIIESNRLKQAGSQMGFTIRGVLGVVIRSRYSDQVQENKSTSLAGEVVEKRTTRTWLDVAIVVQASVVKRLVENLPLP